MKCKEISQERRHRTNIFQYIVQLSLNKNYSKKATNSSGLELWIWGAIFWIFFLLGMSLLDLISFSSSSGTPVNLGEKRFQNSGLSEFHHILHLLIGRRDHRNFLRVTHILLALISIPFHSLHRNYSLLSSSIEFSNEKWCSLCVIDCTQTS